MAARSSSPAMAAGKALSWTPKAAPRSTGWVQETPWSCETATMARPSPLAKVK